MGWMWANCCPLFVPTLAVTLCELCMPETFCELEMCAKNLRELCALCERKTSTKYASRPVGVTSHITPLSIRRGGGGEAGPIGVTSHTTPLAIRRGGGGEAGPIGVTSHTTPLSIRRGVGGEATLSPYPHHDHLTF